MGAGNYNLYVRWNGSENLGIDNWDNCLNVCKILVESIGEKDITI